MPLSDAYFPAGVNLWRTTLEFQLLSERSNSRFLYLKGCMLLLVLEREHDVSLCISNKFLDFPFQRMDHVFMLIICRDAINLRNHELE